MINLDDLKSRSAITLLQTYEGRNPYIQKMKKEYLKNRKVKLTENQTRYIVDFHDKEPQLINKVVKISPLLGKELKEKNDLSFEPERILIEFMLADSEKTFHVYGKLKRNQKKSEMYWLPKTQVMDDPYFEEIDIDVDFEKYIKLDKLSRTPFKHQESGIKFLLSRNGCILADDMGLGKVIANDIPVLTPNGWVPHGSLKVGDYVIGKNGKPTKVLETYPKPLKDYYNIIFSDGTVVESCDEHLWAVQTTNHKNRGNGFVVKPLKDLMGDLTYGTKGNLKWYIPMVEPVEFNKREILIDPYLLGVLLGDGSISSRNLSITSVDLPLINEVKNRLPENIELSNYSTPKEYGFKLKNSNDKNYLKDGLVKYDLFGTKSDNKFIPDDYKYNTINVRIEILQGLMDTDGWCSKKDGTIQYYSVSKTLSDDVKELVQSFGGVARQSSKIGKYKLPDGSVKECKKCFILTINLPEDIIPFRLKRKLDNMKKNRKYLPSRGIKSIEFSRKTYGQCIRVDSDDHLYVIDKYVVTHNTYQAIVSALESGAERILIVCPSAVKINWEREINNFDPNTAIVSGRKWNRDKFTIINYDILKNFHTLSDGKKDKDGHIIEFNRELVNSKFDLCVIDEAHYLKNHKSIRGKIMQDLCVKHKIEKVWLLTGTPIANRPMDFYNLLKLIKAPIADNWKFYAQRYCDGKRFYKTLRNGHKKQIWITDGASNLEELSIKTKNIILRRKKTEVLDMPDKIVSPNYHKLTRKSSNEYDNLWEEYLEKRRKEKKGRAPDKDLVELILLRKFIATEAIPYTIEDAENAIEQGQKVIIFTTFTDELDELAEHFGNKCVVHNGPMSASAKQNSVDEFQNNDKIKVFIGNIKSAGVGITLTAANYIIFNSFSWVPGDNDQAEDRCIFGGQWVLTENGYTLIEDVNIGDKVYTHEGNFKKVIDKHSHLERKKLRYDINAFGFNEDLSITHDHKLYVYNNEIGDFKWLEAKDIDILKHSLTIKSKPLPEYGKKYLIVDNYVDNTFKNNYRVKQKNGRLNELPVRVELTNELLYAFGFFIADGWTSLDNNKSCTVNVCQKINNPKMYDAAEYIMDIIKESFNLKKYSHYIDKNNTKTCTIHSKNLALNFKNWFGSNVYNKQLPYWVDELSETQLKSLLDGYYHGDGYQRKNIQQATTSSLKLVSQLIRYNANLGRSVSLFNKGNNNYTIEYSLTESKNNRIKNIGGYIIYPIKSIHISKPKRGEERVYDLSIEDDHSFVVGNYNVHNCYRIGQKSNVTVKYQLFLNTVSMRIWNTLHKKRDIIETIMGEKDIDESEIERRIIDEIVLNDYEDES